MATGHLILDKKQTLQKIKRIAFEIYEQNYKEKELVLAGIHEKGYLFAQLLQKELEEISPLKIHLIKVEVDKLSAIQSEVKLDTKIDFLKNKSLIITDDVMNTGRTLAYALKPFLSIQLKKLQTAVIVDRSHQLYPIVADYIGYSLATTLKDHINVSLKGKDVGVFIS